MRDLMTVEIPDECPCGGIIYFHRSDDTNRCASCQKAFPLTAVQQRMGIVATDENADLRKEVERLTAQNAQMLNALQELRNFYGKPEHASTIGQQRAMKAAVALIADATFVGPVDAAMKKDAHHG